MKKLRTTDIDVGTCLEEALFLPNGQKLLNQGVTITERHRQVLLGLPDPELYTAKSLDELVEAGVVRAVESRHVRPGQRADRDMLAKGGHLIVEQGQEIEQHHIDAMEGGAYAQEAREQQADQARLRRERMVMADVVVENLQQETQKLPLRVPPNSIDIWHEHTLAEDNWPEAHVLAAEREQIVQKIRGWFSQIESGVSTSAGSIQAVVDTLYEQLLNYPRHVTQLAMMHAGRDRYLPDHAFSVTLISMAIAAHLKWSSRHVKTVGLCGLLMDVGMLLVPERIRIGGCALSEIDRNRVQRHTAFTVALLDGHGDIDALARLAMYQHHERETGVGYPCGTRGDRICDYARVLGVADVFCAAVSYRSYHKPKIPYVVMEELIRSAAAGIFCKTTTRALVQAAGLFPVGSYVVLSNRRIAHVLATNIERLDRPIVRVLNDDGSPTDYVIDLMQIPVDQLTVVRPAHEPEKKTSLV